MLHNKWLSFVVLLLGAGAVWGHPHPTQDDMSRLESFLKTLTPDEHSLLERRLLHETRLFDNPYSMTSYEQNYILPYYYTEHPAQAVYEDATPDGQRVHHAEFKTQFSVQMPLLHLFGFKRLSLHASYTQVGFWQLYAQSPYFRETDHEPQLFIKYRLSRNGLLEWGINHQSNGKGGALERSWNRMYMDFKWSGRNWLASFKPWLLAWNRNAADLHNPDITRYLGHARMMFTYRFPLHQISVIAVGPSLWARQRGHVQLEWSWPLMNHFKLFFQLFSGYGQSLIEYDHFTRSAGMGLSLNVW